MNAPHLGPDRRSMPVSDWPETDREIWQAALAPGDLLDEGGARTRYAEASNSMVPAGYGFWLTWLSRRGLLDPEASPAERIQPQTVAAWVAEMQHRGLASNTIVTRLQALHAMAKVLDGGKDWRWMRRIEAHVHARHVAARSKRDRLVGSADLLELGVQLMEGAPPLTTDRVRAMQFRNGLIIAFLAARPLRLRNLTGLELERTLIARGDGWWIDIPGDETKTSQPIDVPWPEALNLALATYLAVYRPILCRLRNRWTRPVGNALWVSTHGSPMGYFALADTIDKQTATAFGRSVNPNLFRDCAATSIAIEDPAHVRVASQILGHRSAATTERYYNQAQAIEAARQYQAFLVALRRGTMSDAESGKGV